MAIFNKGNTRTPLTILVPRVTLDILPIVMTMTTTATQLMVIWVTLLSWLFSFSLAVPINGTNSPALRFKLAYRDISCTTTDASTPRLVNVTHDYLGNYAGLNPQDTRNKSSCLRERNSDLICGEKRTGRTCMAKTLCRQRLRVHQNGALRCSVRDHSTGDVFILDREYFMGLDVRLRFLNESLMANESDSTLIQLRQDDGENVIWKTGEENWDLQAPPETLYLGVTYRFECHFISYMLKPPIVWTAKFQNGTQRELARQNKDSYVKETIESGAEDYKSEISVDVTFLNVTIERELREISCTAPSPWNREGKEARSIFLVDAQRSEAPQFDHANQNTLVNVYEGDSFELPCQLTKVGRLIPEFRWTKDGKNMKVDPDQCITRKGNSTLGSSILSFCKAKMSDKGKYSCEVQNFGGSSKINFTVQVSRRQNFWVYFVATLAAIMLILVGIIWVISRNRYTRLKDRLTRFDIAVFMNGEPQVVKKIKCAVSMHENLQYVPYNKNYEINWNRVKLEDECLGSGQYGVVMKAHLDDRVIAAKTVKPEADKQIILALLSELKIMIYLDRHEHVVELIGSCTRFLRQGRPYIFTEFCRLGSLEDFLRSNRNNFGDPVVDDTSSEEVRGPVRTSGDYTTLWTLGTKDLVRWSGQVASGMEFLERKKVIHGDIATRNVLLSSIDKVKIADFGLSRRLYQYATYVKSQQELVPWRWLAIESLKDMTFTTKSDVWSFGVTIWEIFSLAQLPYPGYGWSEEFLLKLEQGLRPQRPKHATIQIYDELKRYWTVVPEDRPSFVEIKKFFENLKPTSSN